jgi:hypothetical protein
MEVVTPKGRFIYGLHGAIFQKMTVLFITIVVRTSNSTHLALSSSSMFTMGKRSDPIRQERTDGSTDGTVTTESVRSQQSHVSHSISVPPTGNLTWAEGLGEHGAEWRGVAWRDAK